MKVTNYTPYLTEDLEAALEVAYIEADKRDHLRHEYGQIYFIQPKKTNGLIVPERGAAVSDYAYAIPLAIPNVPSGERFAWSMGGNFSPDVRAVFHYVLRQLFRWGWVNQWGSQQRAAGEPGYSQLRGTTNPYDSARSALARSMGAVHNHQVNAQRKRANAERLLGQAAAHEATSNRAAMKVWKQRQALGIPEGEKL